MKIQTMIWITILHTSDGKYTDKQRTNINEEKGCGELNHIIKLELQFAKRIIFIQSPNNLVLFTHISYICYIYPVNQMHDILVGCEKNVDDTPSLDFRFNIISPLINIHIATIHSYDASSVTTS